MYFTIGSQTLRTFLMFSISNIPSSQIPTLWRYSIYQRAVAAWSSEWLPYDLTGDESPMILLASTIRYWSYMYLSDVSKWPSPSRTKDSCLFAPSLSLMLSENLRTSLIPSLYPKPIVYIPLTKPVLWIVWVGTLSLIVLFLTSSL